MRKGEFTRKTKETEIKVNVNLDGSGSAEICLPIRFMSHLLTSLASHSLIDIKLIGEGDLMHHIIEDAAICLGEALHRALGDGTGIHRFGYSMVPMDDSLAIAVIDISGRSYTVINLKLAEGEIEDCQIEDIEHFLVSLASTLKANLHLSIVYGNNNHHNAEAAFKALALALRQAVSIDPKRSGIPSSKGVL